MDLQAWMCGLLPVCLFTMTTLIGLDLIPGSFSALLRAPRPLVVGLVGQVLLVPVCGVALAWWFRATPEIALGMVLVVAAPGGPVSNAIVYLFGGRPELSLSLSALNGVLSLLLTPLVVALGFYWVAGQEEAVQLPLQQTLLHILTVAVLPVILGVVLRRQGQRWVRWLPITRRLAMLMLGLVLTMVVVMTAGSIRRHWHTMLPAALLLCLLIVAATWWLARCAGLDAATRFTIATEVSIHNAPMVVLIAQVLLGRMELAAFVAVYVPCIAAITLGLGAWHRFQSQRPLRISRAQGGWMIAVQHSWWLAGRSRG